MMGNALFVVVDKFLSPHEKRVKSFVLKLNGMILYPGLKL